MVGADPALRGAVASDEIATRPITLATIHYDRIAGPEAHGETLAGSAAVVRGGCCLYFRELGIDVKAVEVARGCGNRLCGGESSEEERGGWSADMDHR